MADGAKITATLLKRYPAPKIALRFSNPLELLIATILSAQCTDARVNAVTQSLFKQYRSAKDYAEADPAPLETAIRSTGFYKSKAKAIQSCCRKLQGDFGGRVPETLAELTSLPGVGRKTANVVLSAAFGQPAIAVDRHVLRVSNRLGLVHVQDPVKAEFELMGQIPRKNWTAFSLATILHGRETCTARAPRCGACVLFELCEWPEKDPGRI